MRDHLTCSLQVKTVPSVWMEETEKICIFFTTNQWENITTILDSKSKHYGLCAWHHSMETPANHNCTLLKVWKHYFYSTKIRKKKPWKRSSWVKTLGEMEGTWMSRELPGHAAWLAKIMLEISLHLERRLLRLGLCCPALFSGDH